MENMEVSQKTKTTTTIYPRNFSLGNISKKKKTTKTPIQKIHDPSVHSSIIDFAKAWKQLQCL